MVHLFKYLRGTQDIPLILRADGSGILKWYMDASHRVHQNMRGHTGGGLTMGTGFPVSTSTKQKLNTRSSTETENVGVVVACQECCRPGCFCKRKTMELKKILCSKTNKLPCC